jgi:SHS2 domain-containing protein
MHNNQTVNDGYFDNNATISIVGHGESIETSFADAASALFALLADTAGVRPFQIITFDFIEEDIDAALQTWLNLVLAKSQERNLAFTDFRLKREANIWKATVSGEPWRDDIKRGLQANHMAISQCAVRKEDYIWEARCLLAMSP